MADPVLGVSKTKLEREREYRKRWLAKNGNREKMRLYKRAWNKKTQSWKRYAEQTKLWKAANKESVNRKQRLRLVKALYGLSQVWYDDMIVAQEGCCALCRRHQSNFKKGLGVDHDHDTGRVRELLCVACNLGLGSFGDDPTRLRLAVAYLEKHDKDK